MKDREGDFIAAGAQIVWVLQDTLQFGPATSPDSDTFYTSTIGSSVGLRVGDGTTTPDLAETPGRTTFEDAAVNTFFSNRGTVLVVRKSDMQIFYGEEVDNVNRPTPDELLAEIAAVP